jgi:hypothetical protein
VSSGRIHNDSSRVSFAFMQAPINQLYKFGQFCLDVSELVLRHDGRVAPLSPKLFEVLAQITFSTTIYSEWFR